jgi:hypothetical protein
MVEHERMELVDLSVDGRRVVGTVFAAEGAGKRPGILFVHGLRSDQIGYRIRARTVAGALGAACLTFDLSGHGAPTPNWTR